MLTDTKQQRSSSGGRAERRGMPRHDQTRISDLDKIALL